MSTFPTYAYDESGRVAAFHGDKLIASGPEFKKVAETAEEYFDALRNEHKKQATEKSRKSATHITTPNGKTGEILGRASGLWSDEITVRFENGQIRRYATYVDDGLKYSNEQRGFGKTAAATPMEAFQHELDETYSPGRDGLTARLNTLEEIRRGAAHLASQGVSYADGQALHRIVLAADAERNEVREALDYLVTADAEAIAPPKMAYQVVEQADLGPTGDWLEVVANEMVAESEAEDFDKLQAEGPTEFVSGLETAALANTGVVRDMVTEFIHAKTAGFKGEAVEQYRDQFVASTELARKRELVYRQEVTAEATAKVASTVENVPDEALFI